MPIFFRSMTVCMLASVLALAQGRFQETIRIGGSTTLLPVIAECANQFTEKYGTWDRVDPAFPKAKIMIFVTGGGSGFGINAAIQDTVDLGMSSRDIEDGEKVRLGVHKVTMLSKDCIAFAASRQSPLAKVDNLTREDVVRIFTGEAKTFQDLRADLPRKPILVQIRDSAGGSTEILQQLILKQKTFTSQAMQVPSQGANLNKLETNPAAVGYLSSAQALHSAKLKVFKFEGVLPTNENVLSGAYLVTRPLLMVRKGQTTPQEQKFLDFLLHEGQAVFQEHGYVPARQLH